MPKKRASISFFKKIIVFLKITRFKYFFDKSKNKPMFSKMKPNQKEKKKKKTKTQTKP